MYKIATVLLALLFLNSCKEELISPEQPKPEEFDISGLASIVIINTRYVSTTGNDANSGTAALPWRTIRNAVSKVPANQAYNLQVAAGTYVESGIIDVPTGVSITGAGTTQTIIKAASSFYYYPADPGYALDKYLFRLSSGSATAGNQQLVNFTIDGDAKKLHGGIYVKSRNFVEIRGVAVKNTNFNGIWLWDVQDSQIANTSLTNCSWGSSGYCAGALNLGNVTRVDIGQLTVDEGVGYGIKAIGPSGANNIISTKIHDSYISVAPLGMWNGGSAPNIAIELWQVNLVGNEIYNTYVDNTISLVNNTGIPASGVQTIRVHHNTLDMDTRAHGEGYGIELSIHDVEVDHNYFLKGSQGIANWSDVMRNWSIHHNTFYALQGVWPGEIVRSQSSGLHNVKLYNNTVELASNKTMNIIGIYGGASDNLDVKNNLFIDNSTGQSFYPNQFVHMENGATLTVLTVKNNLFRNLPIGSVPGTYSGNLTSNPMITASGARPDPWYKPLTGSPLINAGLNVGLPFTGPAPTIGALETSGGPANTPPIVVLTSPASGATFASGAAVTITATASDPGGSVTKVEFFRGSTKIGEDLTSPYSMVLTATSGTAVLTAKATDNGSLTTTSLPVTITVTGGSLILNLDSSVAALSGQMVSAADGSAQNGNYFYVPAGTGTNYMIPPPADATYNFTLSAAGSYVIWAKVKSTPTHQSFNIYNGAGTWFIFDAGTNSTWTWVKIKNGASPAMFPFNAGANHFKMAWNEDNVKVDQVVVTNDMGYVPI